LIVEDDSVQAMNLEALLELEGRWVCGRAATGERAVQLARTCLPDVVIMDIGLAGKIDGIEAATRIRTLRTCGPIFLTAYGDDRAKERMRKLAPDAIIDEPASKDILARAVADAVERWHDPRTL
jgi:CheY-like chemotaxis protein